MKSEFAQLSDLAISQGVSHSQLISEIHAAVLDEYRQKYPNAPISSTIFINEVTGEVRILSGKKDITPSDFPARAQQIARQVILGKITPPAASQPTPATPVFSAIPNITPQPRIPSGLMNLLANIFFWGYNIYFFFFSVILTFFYLIAQLDNGPWEGIKAIGGLRLLLLLILNLTPLAATILAIKRKLYRAPGQLGKLFFLFELPVIVASFIPIALAGQTTPFIILLTLLGLCLPVILYLYESGVELSAVAHKVLLFIEQSILMISVYITFLLTFFYPIILGVVAVLFFGNIFADIGQVSGGTMLYKPTDGYIMPRSPPPVPSPGPIFALLIQVAFGLLAILFVSAVMLIPYLFIVLLVKALLKTRDRLSSLLSQDELLALHGIYAVIIIVISIGTAYQPSYSKLIDNLKNITVVDSFAEREKLAREIVPQEQKLKQLISDMYYGQSRYLFAKNDTTLKYAYREIFKLGEDVSSFIQDAFLVAAYPLVFQGERDTSATLAGNFQYIFGYSPYDIKKPEPTKEPQNVLLTYRKVTVSSEANGMLAKIAVEEEYDNVTYQQQEVIYEFTLAPDVAFIDLALGPNLEFPGIIAPKGAAQRTYERELQRRRDPALLEQTGPRQYRLRVFPIPAKNDWTTLSGKRQKVSYTYVASLTPDGFPLPRVTRKTNVFTNSSTRLTMLSGTKEDKIKEDDAWIPLAKTSTPDICKNPPDDVTVAAGDTTAKITALTKLPDVKKTACGSANEALAVIKSAKVALMFDVSSAQKEKTSAQEAKTLLGKNKKFLSDNTVELYKFNDRASDKLTLNENNLDDAFNFAYFGKTDLIGALSAFKESYDAIFVISDSSDTLRGTGAFPFAQSTRVYLVHPKAPPYSMEVASRLLQSQSDAPATLEEALRLYAVSRSAAPSYDNNQLFTSPYITVRFSSAPVLLQSSSGDINLPSPFPKKNNTAAAYINSYMLRAILSQSIYDVTGNIAILDKLNEFAVNAPLVTPYSSLLSLVNEQQEKLLEEFKKQYNRYQDQPIQENLVIPPPQPMPIMSPFEDMRGLDISGSELSLPSPTYGDDIGIMSPMMGKTAPGIIIPRPDSVRITNVANLLFSGLGLFALVNLFILGPAFLFYLIRILKKRS